MDKLARRRELYLINRDKELLRAKLYRESYRAEVRARTAKWKADNKDVTQAYNLYHKTVNKETLYVKRKVYISKNWNKIYAKNGHKILARKHVGLAIPLTGLCQRCNEKEATDRHHHDYSKPLDVELLCGACHSKADLELKASQEVQAH